MKAIHLVPALFLASALPLLADDSGAKSGLSASSDPAAVMQANPYVTNWKDLITEKPATSPLKFGQSDYIITSPLIDAFQRVHTPERQSLWKRIALFPVYLITPLKMPWPPENGGHGYFRWKGESTSAWINASAGGVGGNSMNLIDAEPHNAVISVSKP